SFTATVTAKDAFGNTATGYTGSVSFSSTDAAAVLPGAYAYLAGDNGAHTFTFTLKTAAGGAKTITATGTSLTTTSTATSGITVNAGAAAALQLTNTPAAVSAGSAAAVRVTALDAYGNIASGYTGT